MIPGASGVAGWLASWFSPTTCSTFSSRSPCAPRLRAGVSSASRLVSPRTAPQSRCVLCKPPGSAALCASAQCTAPLCPAGVFSSLDSGLLAALQPQSSDGVSEDHESAARVASFFSVWNDAHSSNTWQKPKHSHGVPSACGSSPLAQAPRRSGSGTLSFPAFPSYVSGSGHRPRGWRGASHRCAAPCPFSLTFKSSLLLPF